MGSSINLLPWREMLRQATRRRFFNKAVFGLVLVSLLVVAGRWVVYHQLTQQEARNARLQQEIDQLNTSLREFAKREVERDELQRRLTLVNSLQKQRNNATLLFNLLPQVIPDGVVLDKVSMTVGSVMIEGRSRDNAKLASLLALLESNAGVEHVQIHSIINNAGSPSRVAKNFRATFYLSDYVTLELPEEDNNNGR
ncbi:pilus assembly protein PilN [Grimontia hollisae]|nr:PilN domain-containing protein [Grimontia hollisae]AMG30400.1 pilus assembly protein PilN [Grimontia hollisae]MDF2183889.1 PilN domain-containing protein [Grimontia hollisae]STO42018.1 Fimbrial assembly protein (PilN) [Grimontia hollisae]STQ77736.1 Fimbrial assembly protein (PilN) [Grimontia hollisae]